MEAYIVWMLDSLHYSSIHVKPLSKKRAFKGSSKFQISKKLLTGILL